jgi:MoxR-like ATPase
MTITSTGLTLPGKFDQIENILNGKVYERNRVVETMLIAVIAEAHHCQIGIPGIAKSMLIDQFHKLIDMEGNGYFRWTLRRHSTPDETEGPVSVKGLENDEYRRNTAGKLPESKLAFIDEIFKANSALLNTFLTIMNEGLYFNGGVPMETRPVIFCGSNEIPKDAELAALRDRITIWHEIKPIQQNSNFAAMLRGKAAQTLRKVQFDPIITWTEIETMQEQARLVSVTEEVIDALVGLRNKLKAAGIEPSDRKFNDCMPVIKATAARYGRSVADIEDLRCVRHILVTDLQRDQAIVDRLVLEIANPLDKEAMDVMETIDSLSTEVDVLLKGADSLAAKRRKGVELNGKLDRAGKELDELGEKAKSSARRSDMIGEAKVRLKSVVDTMLDELFNIKNPA